MLREYERFINKNNFQLLFVYLFFVSFLSLFCFMIVTGDSPKQYHRGIELARLVVSTPTSQYLSRIDYSHKLTP